MNLPAGGATHHRLAEGRGLGLHVIDGLLSVAGIELGPGDAISTETAGDLEFHAGNGPAEALLFDLA